MKKHKKEIILWADDDWMNMSLKDLKTLLVEGIIKEKPCYGIFHYTKNDCYEGKPRKVQITISEIK